MGGNLTHPVVDLSSKVAVVTGGNTGIGYETAKALAEMGAHTFIACRSQEKAAAAIDRMKAEVGEGKELKVEYLLVDLASFSSVKDFVRTFKEKNLPLHILVHNAAVAWVPFTRTDDGLEIQFQVNHLSPLLITLELLPIMLDSASSCGDVRIVLVSSRAHQQGIWNPEMFNPETEEQFSRFRGYPNSKMQNVMTSFALQRRLQNVSITVSSAEPGYVKTGLSRGWQDKKFLSFMNDFGYSVLARTPKQGAATIIKCAVDPQLNSQTAFYYGSCTQRVPSFDSRNEQYQEELWRISFRYLNDHLSPETVEKYGPARTEQSSATGVGEIGVEVTGETEGEGDKETGVEVTGEAGGEGELGVEVTGLGDTEGESPKEVGGEATGETEGEGDKETGVEVTGKAGGEGEGDKETRVEVTGEAGGERTRETGGEGDTMKETGGEGTGENERKVDDGEKAGEGEAVGEVGEETEAATVSTDPPNNTTESS